MRNIPVAGRPSDAPRRASAFAGGGAAAANGTSNSSAGGVGLSITGAGGRRSRRNSIDENASQLSLENLGGSQDNLHLLGRNPDKEMRTHTGRKQQPDNNRSYIDNRELEEMEKHEREASGSSSGAKKQFVDLSSTSSPEKVSFADLRRQKARDQFHTSGINITYQEKEDPPKRSPKNSANLMSWASQQPQAQTTPSRGGDPGPPPPQQQQHRAEDGSTSPGTPSSIRISFHFMQVCYHDHLLFF